jgi:methyl-accepting chemotaxis protein
MISDVTYAQTGKAFMINSKGVTVAHSNQDLVISKDNDFENVKSDAKLTSLVALETKMVAGETGVGQYEYNGIVKYMAYCPVEGTDWFLALTAPQTEVFESVTELAYFILIASLIFIALSVLVANILAGSIIKPIKRTAEFAVQLAKGETNAQIQIKSHDEVGQLADTLDNQVREAFIKINKAQAIAVKQNQYQAQHAERLVINLDRLAKGELYCDMEVEQGDQDTTDLYDLFNSFKESLYMTTSTIKGYIVEISNVLAKISDGDLTVGIKSQYKGDFVALKDSINGIVSSIGKTMSEIDSAAKQVSAGTVQVSSGSQTISQGATEQASSIEELSASITQIAAQTKQNAANASKANELALSAQTEAVSGNNHMSEMQDAMAKINESSENISKIIKVIDDIAFQTNILALNAAVEAARAGVHGKGFAVVAEEVRNLAARSANAAKETTELIEGSIKKVEAGTKIADQTAAALSSIVTGVEKAANLVGQIASASNEQATGISQVNRGIEQLSQVVQTNSATAEEAAAASEELSSQADLLKSMVAQFKLQDTQAKSLDSSKKRPALKEANGTAEISLSDQDYGKY